MTITLETMLRHMGWANQQIISQIVQLPDEALDEKSIEHKCQAVTALEFRGFKAPDLDESDLWGYERSTK
jgi:hypothetical protein